MGTMCRDYLLYIMYTKQYLVHSIPHGVSDGSHCDCHKAVRPTRSPGPGDRGHLPLQAMGQSFPLLGTSAPRVTAEGQDNPIPVQNQKESLLPAPNHGFGSKAATVQAGEVCVLAPAGH